MTTPPTRSRERLVGLLERHRGGVGGAGALAATGLALTWLVVVPAKVAEVGPVQAGVLRLGHPACWALLAIAAAAWAVRAPRSAVEWPARGALAAYAAFLVALAL